MNTLRSLYWESTRSVRFITILMCLLGALGIWARSDTTQGDMHLVFHLAPWWAWSGGLLVVAVHRYWCLWRSAVCCADCLETIPGIFVCVGAIFIWSTLLVSSAIATDFGLALMILVCCFIEAWLLSRHAQHLVARFGRGKK
jgi:hypothetical protein